MKNFSLKSEKLMIVFQMNYNKFVNCNLYITLIIFVYKFPDHKNIYKIFLT